MTILGSNYAADTRKAVPDPYYKQLLHLFSGEWCCEL